MIDPNGEPVKPLIDTSTLVAVNVVLKELKLMLPTSQPVTPNATNCEKLPFPTESTDWHVTGPAIAKDESIANPPKHNNTLDFIPYSPSWSTRFWTRGQVG